jgi:hypothetical protein
VLSSNGTGSTPAICDWKISQSASSRECLKLVPGRFSLCQLYIYSLGVNPLPELQVNGKDKVFVSWRTRSIRQGFVHSRLAQPRLSRRRLVSCFEQTILECLNCAVDIVPGWIKCAGAHVAEADVLGSNVFVQASGEDHTLLEELREHIGRSQAVREIHGGHTIGLILGLRRKLFQSQSLDSLFDLLRGGMLLREPVLEGFGENLRQGCIQCPYELR